VLQGNYNIVKSTIKLICFAKAKPPISITAFIGHEDLSDENKNILRNYVDTRNSK